jgi:hypothetical protein
MNIVLLLVCIYAFVKRSSIDRTTSLHQTMIVAIVGLLNAILLMAAFSSDFVSLFSTLLSGLFFGLVITPLTWMVGITLFLTVAKDKRPKLVIVGYFFTFIQLVLMIVTITFLSKLISINTSYGYHNDQMVYGDIFISIISINWVFFLLFFALVIQYRRSVSGKIMATLLIFGILNTGRLIMETIFTFTGVDLKVSTVLYLSFFFTDFISVISLYISTIFWKGLKYSEPVYDS